jgi:hypothetical protein
MPNYSNTVIYKICCRDVNVPEIYIGSTCNFINRRRQHKGACIYDNNKAHNFKVYEFIRNHGGWDNWEMVMIEERSVETKLQKDRLEREWIEKLKSSLNCNIPTRTHEEWIIDNPNRIKENTKAYYINNAEKLKEKSKQNRLDNPEYYNAYNIKYTAEHKEEAKIKGKQYQLEHAEEIAAYRKKYREENPDYFKDYGSNYYQNNKEKIKEQQSEKIECACGKFFTRHHKARHEKSKRHTDFVDQSK